MLRAIALAMTCVWFHHGIIVGGVTDGVGVMEGVRVIDGVRVGRGVRVAVAVGVDVGVFEEVGEGGNTRVGVSNTSGG